MFDKKLWSQQYHMTHKDKIKTIRDTPENKRKLKAYQNTPEYKAKKKAYQKEYIKNNKAKINQTRREYNKNHQSQVKEARKKSYKKFKEKINKKCNEYRLLNRDKIIKCQKEHNRKYPEKQLARNKRQIEKLNTIWNFSFHKIRYALISWSRTVRKRDNYICKICGNKGNFSHHIFHKVKYPLLAFNVNNGITLCRKCHTEVHGMRLGV